MAADFVGKIRHGFYFSTSGSVITIEGFKGLIVTMYDGKWCIQFSRPIGEVINYSSREDAQNDAILFGKAFIEILDAKGSKIGLDPT